MLGVAGPKDRDLRPFNTDEFQPPANPADWKYGSPDALTPPPDPDAGRVRLKDVLRKADPVVSVSAQVLAGGRPVRDLGRGDFVVRDAGVVQEITDFAFAAQPLDIMLLIEATPEMADARTQIRSGLSRALGQLDARDRVGIVLFAEKQLLLLDLAADRNMIGAAAAKVQALPGAQDLNSALAVASQHLRDHARPEAARAIVVIAGRRGQSEISDRVVRDALWQTRVMVFGGESVRQFIEATGGAELETPGPLFAGLRERYQITWRAPGGMPKNIRKIAIELSDAARARIPDAAVRATAAYVVE